MMPRPSLQSRNFVGGCRMPVLDGEALEFCCIPQGLASEGPSIGSGPKHVLSAWNRPNDTGVAQHFVLRAALAPWTMLWTCRLPAADLSVLPFSISEGFYISSPGHKASFSAQQTSVHPLLSVVKFLQQMSPVSEEPCVPEEAPHCRHT